MGYSAYATAILGYKIPINEFLNPFTKIEKRRCCRHSLTSDAYCSSCGKKMWEEEEICPEIEDLKKDFIPYYINTDSPSSEDATPLNIFIGYICDAGSSRKAYINLTEVDLNIFKTDLADFLKTKNINPSNFGLHSFLYESI